MKSFLKIFIPLLAVYLIVVYFASAAPVSNLFRNIAPESDITYESGTSTARWLTIYAQNASTTNLTAFGRLLVGGTATTSIRGDSATSTFSWSINIPTGQCYQINGTCLSTGGITSLNGLTGATQTFTANGNLAIVSSGTDHAFNASSSPYVGTLTASSTAHVNSLLVDTTSTFSGLVTMAGFISTASSTITGELHAGTLDIDNFATGDMIIQGDIYNYGGDHFLGTGLATTTLTVNAANILQITGGGFIAQASSTVVGAFRANSAVFNSALGLASGGTNATSFTTSGNAVYYNGTSLLTAPLGSAITIPYASSTALTASGGLFIPQGTAPTFSAIGQLALDTTSNQLLVGTSTVNNPIVLDPRRSFKFMFATTTLVYIGSFGTAGTTTIVAAGYDWPVEFYNAICETNGGVGTTTFRIGDGTNYSPFVFGDSRPNGIETAFSGLAIAANTDIYVEIGTLKATVSESVSCDFAYKISRE